MNMARDAMSSFNEESLFGKLLPACLLLGIVAHLLPWVQSEVANASAMGLKLNPGVISAIALAVALAISVYTLAAEGDGASRRNMALLALAGPVAALIAQIVFWSSTGARTHDSGLLTISVRDESAAWGFYLSFVFSLGALFLSALRWKSLPMAAARAAHA
jgi:hypothetical protein